jgi:hypothetical protein
MDADELTKALAIIEAGTSIATVSEYLRAKSINHSAGSWKQLRDDRIRPAITAGKLTELDLRALMREIEDFGRQHVFFYNYTGDKSSLEDLLHPEKVDKAVKKNGWARLVSSVKVVAMPKTGIELVDIHFDETYLSFKFVERRTVVVTEREPTADGYRVRKTTEEVRAINIVRLDKSGLLEFRIATKSGTADYVAIVNELWPRLENFFPRTNFAEKDLTKVRQFFIINPSEAVKRRVRVRLSSGKNTDGTRFALAMGAPAGNLMDSAENIKGIAALAGSNTRLGHTTLGFLAQNSGLPNRELTAVITDAVNEVRIRQNCTQREYEYIRGEIARHS